MTDKNNSFETVELIKPVSLMQIDGSDLADAKDEAKAAQVPAKTAGEIADNAVTVSAATDIDTKTDAGYQAVQRRYSWILRIFLVTPRLPVRSRTIRSIIMRQDSLLSAL